jgi:glycosyltransferase involved in cell wall biosynthesis
MNGMPRRRVVIVTPWYPSARDPVAGIFVQAQARALSRRHDVAVIAPDYRGLRTVARSGLRRPQAAPADDFPVLRPVAVGPVPRSKSVTSITYARAVRQALAELAATWGSPDILHAHVVLPAGHATASAARSLSIPFVLTEHWSRFGELLRWPATRSLVRQTLAAAARVTAVSPVLSTKISGAAPLSEVDVIGNVVDTGFFAAVPDPVARDAGTPLRLVIIGKLDAPKGIDVLLRAIGECRSRGTDVELAVVGGGPKRGEYAGLATALGLAEVVHFDGVLTAAGVRLRYQWCDAVVVASRFETFGMTVAEGLASGRPVIATRCGGPEFIIEPEAGRLVPVGDVLALADAIAELAAGAWHFDPLPARRSIERRFGIDAIVGQLSALYEEVLAP